MRKIIVLILWLLGVMSITGLYAQDDEKMNVAGMGVLVSSSPYDDGDTNVYPAPIIKWANDYFFVEGEVAGFSFIKNDDVRASLILTPHLEGYDDNDADVLSGMEDRDRSLDAGGQLLWHLPMCENLDLTLDFVSDLLGNHEGQEAKVALSKTFKFEKFHLAPSLGIRWKSENVVDYYYGVMPSEATATRPQYEPDSTVNFFGYLNYYQGLPKDWVLVTRIGFEVLGDEINDSPLVDKSVTVKGLIGLAKRF